MQQNKESKGKANDKHRVHAQNLEELPEHVEHHENENVPVPEARMSSKSDDHFSPRQYNDKGSDSFDLVFFKIQFVLIQKQSRENYQGPFHKVF